MLEHTPVDTSRPIPLLNNERLDWLNARYEAEAEFNRHVCTVKHKLSNASEIERLITERKAAFVAEVRCPRTMLVTTYHCHEAPQIIELPTTERDDNLYLLPGVVALQPLEVPASSLHELIRGNRSQVGIPEGWWIARGETQSFLEVLGNLVKFGLDKELPEGRMRVEETGDDSEPSFRVMLAKNIYEHIHLAPDIQRAGLIAACGKIPFSKIATNEEAMNSRVAEVLRDKLNEAQMPDWNAEDWDPAQLATLLEPFKPPVQDADEE